MYINCAAYRQGRRTGEIAVEQISDELDKPETFVWVGLANPTPAELLKLQEEFGLHELSVEDARNAYQRPKLEEYPEFVFVVLHTVEFKDGDVIYGETHLFVGKQFLISIRHGSAFGYAGVRQRCENLPHLLAKGPGFALYAVMDFIVDHYLSVVGRYEEMLDALEANVLDGIPDRQVMERLYEFKRNLVKLRNAAAPMLDICNGLMRFHPDVASRDLRVYFRDVHDHVHRVLNAIDMMRDALTDATQVNFGMITIRQNEVVKRLAGWGAILAIPTMLFSMYGMNFRHMPELDEPYGYPATLAATFLGCLWLYRRLKRTGWL